MTPNYIYDPRLGGQFPLGPSAWLRTVQHGTSTQKLRAWFVLGLACAVVLGIVAFALFSAA
jgi:hypothetical protein